MINLFDDFGYFVNHRVPIGKVDGRIVYKDVKGLRVDLDEDIMGEFSLEFIESLPSYYKVQIGDTFYNKVGAEFVYDYLNSSYDYQRNLEELVYKEIWIFRDV